MTGMSAFVRSFFTGLAADIWNGLVRMVRPPMIWATIGLAVAAADLMWIAASHH